MKSLKSDTQFKSSLSQTSITIPLDDSTISSFSISPTISAPVASVICDLNNNEFLIQGQCLFTNEFFKFLIFNLGDRFDKNEEDFNKQLLNRRQWSLRTLRSKFIAKNTEFYFKRYQTRLCHRLFTIILILNIIIYLFESIWYFSFRVSEFLFLICELGQGQGQGQGYQKILE